MVKKVLLILILVLLIVILMLVSTMAKANSNSSEIERHDFRAPSENIVLDGYILRNPEVSQPQPTIVFVVGSGVGSTIENYKRTTEFFFDDYLLSKGFAVAYFDKRGLGQSEGVWYTTTFEQRALDAKNVALHIRDYDFIDPEKIFVVGHSQGGWIVQIALAEYPDVFAGGISMAGPTFSVREQMINDAASKIACETGLDETEAFKKASRKVSRDLFFISIVGWRGNLRQLNLIKDFDPEPYLLAINKPLLMLFGEHDPLVSPDLSLKALDRIFAGTIPPHIEHYIGAGEEHSFKIAPKCFQGSWRDLKFSERTRSTMGAWLTTQLQLAN